MDLAKERLSQLYNYFKAVEDRRTPRITNIKEQKWLLWLESLPKHEKIAFENNVTEDGAWLKIIRPVLTDCPKPPEVLDGWLTDDWKNISTNDIAIKPQVEIILGGDTSIEKFEDLPDRGIAFSVWKLKRAQWRDRELPAREVAKVWDKIFSLHNELNRDGESWELMLGDGHFSYVNSQLNAYHPVVLRKVELRFNPATKEFIISDSDTKPEFYSPVFASDEFAGLAIKKWQHSLEFEDLHPLDQENLDYWFEGLAGSMLGGSFQKGMPVESSKTPLIGRSPVLFLRPRATGRNQFIHEILAHIPEADSFPSSLLSIVGITPTPISLDDSEGVSDAYANEHDDVLLTKPANAEQVAILRKLSKQDGVLVQGPPGTGKTHTIANLISSFLADGKSVLVTSHTTKALRVVRSQVSEQLRSLCVSVLDSDAQSRLERELAIRELASRLSDNPEQYIDEAERLKKLRRELLLEIKSSRIDLLKAVEGEYISIVCGGRDVSPSNAAKEVAAGVGIHDWIPGPIDLSSPMPLTEAEVRILLQSSKVLTQLDEAELQEEIPEIFHLPSEQEFAQDIDEYNELKDSELGYRIDLWTSNSSGGVALDEIVQDLNQLIQYLKQLQDEPWKLAVIQAGMEKGQAYQIWGLLCDNILELRKFSEQSAKAIFEYGPEIVKDSMLDEQLRVVQEIESYLKTNSKISWLTLTFKSKWNEYIEQWRVNGKAPQNSDHFIAIRQLIELKIERNKVAERWNRVMPPLGVSSLFEVNISPEEYAFQYVTQIQTSLNWHESNWLKLENSLVGQGLNWLALLGEAPPATTAHHLAERLRHTVEKNLPRVVIAEMRRRRLAQITSQLASIENLLQGCIGQRKTESQVTEALISGVKSRSKLIYAQAIERLRSLDGLKPIYKDRCNFLNRLKPSAPVWVEMITNHQDLGVIEINSIEPSKAWSWLQLNQELNSRSSLSLEVIQEKIKQLSQQLQDTTVTLVENLAWSGLLKKVTEDQRQSLLGWAATMKRIGGGKSKLVQGFMRQARGEMERARAAVPVWIMPFSQVTSSFHPIRDKFDVIIVDEASQEDVLGLVPFYMAKKVIVVGDDEQVTPLDVGGLQQPVQNLIGQWLSDMPSPMLFDMKSSVYDRSQIAFGSVIRLKEHFRCVPEIIQFSNALSYDFTIKPLRESASSLLKPAMVAHRVEGSVENKVNLAEAEEIVNLICACVDLLEYKDKSIGVICMVGDKQADKISNMLRARLDPAVYDQRRILCGNPAQFQGDERDVIFLSLVDSKDDGLGPLTLKQDGADGMLKKRFNVAASRAKDQLWVVYSIDPNTQLKPGDIRRRLIEHAINPSALMDELSNSLRKTESPFEAEVLKLLVAEGYKVHPQWQVGAYRIDMVVEGNGKRLAVECDGDRWHYDKVEEDLARQALLERLGWNFVRIRGSTFYRDKSEHRAAAMKPLFDKLKEFGIEPIGQASSIVSESGDLIERVKRRAYELNRIEGDLAQFAVSDDIDEIEQPPLIVKSTESLPTKIEKTLHQIAISEFIPKSKSFEVMQRVRHPSFGLGTIVAVKKNGDVNFLDINFDAAGLKTINPVLGKLELI